MHVEKIEIMPAVTARIPWRIEVPHWHHYRATLSLSLAARLACAVYGADCCCCCIIGGDHDLRTADACPRLGPKTKSILLVWHHSDVEPMRPTPRLAGAGVACIEANHDHVSVRVHMLVEDVEQDEEYTYGMALRRRCAQRIFGPHSISQRAPRSRFVRQCQRHTVGNADALPTSHSFREGCCSTGPFWPMPRPWLHTVRASLHLCVGCLVLASQGGAVLFILGTGRGPPHSAKALSLKCIGPPRQRAYSQPRYD
jgi:hypothetical protein